MEKKHKDQITKHRDYLIQNTKFDELWQKLNENTVIIPEYMTEDILSTNSTVERNERFYDLIQQCEPDGFQQLITALSSSNQNELSLLLLDDKLYTPQMDVTSSNHYPHLPPLLPPEIEVCRKSKLSQYATVKQNNPKYSYFVRSNPRGYLLLINMQFKRNPLEDERHGSEVDVINLKNLFTQLNFSIVYKHDLTLPEMEHTVKDFSNMEELRNVDSVVVFVMSHGRNPAQRKPHEPPLSSPGGESVDIELEDNKYINSNDIVEQINKSTTIRANVPRLFFFNMCRGGKSDMGPGNVSASYEDQNGEQDTSTQIDAQPFLDNNSSSETESHSGTEINQNHERNGHVLNENIQTPPNNENSHRSSNGHVHSPVNGSILENNSSSPTSNQQRPQPANLSIAIPPISNSMNRIHHCDKRTVCCCILIPNSPLRRPNVLTRCAIWFSNTFKCSMPTIEEEIERYQPNRDSTDKNDCNGRNGGVCSLPNGAPNRGGNDSPDSHIEIVWPTNSNANPEINFPEMIIADPPPTTVSRSSSKSLKKISSFSSRLPHFLQKSPNPEQVSSLTGDIFMAFSTVDGFNSKRHPKRGSWFVTLICQVFAESAANTDLMSMMDEVDRRLRDMFDVKYGRQLCVKKTEGFSKKFYFNVELDQSNTSSPSTTPTTPT